MNTILEIGAPRYALDCSVCGEINEAEVERTKETRRREMKRQAYRHQAR